MKILIRIVAVVAVLAIVGLVVLYFSLGGIVKKGVESVGPMVTKVDVKLGGANISPFSGNGQLSGLVVGNPEGFKTPSAIKVGEVSVGVKPGSLFADKVVVTSVRVINPEITFEGSLKGSNLSKILDNVNAAAGSAGGGGGSNGPGKKLQVDEFVISGAKVNLSATLLGGKSITVPLPDIRLTDLGKDANGITAGELTQRVMKALMQEVTQAAGSAITSLGKGATDAVKDLGGKGTDGVKKAAEGVKSLFKK
ncbi:MAG: hypothetical protein HY043_00810 [Verrucomicrobia bacterium]|nr:hypothetical protein [Verrucomicrobiota bacterium]